MEELSITKDTIEHNSLSKKEYNDVPVVYCKHCLSLTVRNSYGVDYCDKCGGTDIASTHIYNWEDMYEQKYNKNYLTKK